MKTTFLLCAVVLCAQICWTFPAQGKQEKIVIPEEVVVVSGALNVRDGNLNKPGGRTGKVIEIGADKIPIISGVRVPDDASDRKVWRNARVINGMLITKSDEKEKNANQIWRNARVINGKLEPKSGLSSSVAVSSAQQSPVQVLSSSDVQPRILYSDGDEPQNGLQQGQQSRHEYASYSSSSPYYGYDNSQQSDGYASYGYGDQGYGDNQAYAGDVGYSYATQGYSGEQDSGVTGNGFLPGFGNVITKPADPSDFVIKDYTYGAGQNGLSYSVPIPVPQYQLSNGYQTGEGNQFVDYGVDTKGNNQIFSEAPEGQSEQADGERPNRNRQGRPGQRFFQAMRRAFRRALRRQYKGVQRMVEPIMTPIREITNELGLTEPIHQVQERLADVGLTPENVMGAALTLGALGLGAYALNNVQVEITRSNQDSALSTLMSTIQEQVNKAQEKRW